MKNTTKRKIIVLACFMIAIVFFFEVIW